MKKIIIFTLSLFGILIGAFTQNFSKIDTELQEEISKTKDLYLAKGDEKVSDSEIFRINIILNAQYPQIELRNKVNTIKNKNAKRNFVVNELKQFSEETQKDLLTLLKNLTHSDSENTCMSFWISNSINCYATIETIETISEHPDVLLIGYDKEQNLLPQHDPPTPVDPTREITNNVLKVQANDVWELGHTGEGVVVAIIDTGVNYIHVDIRDNMWEHPDYPFFGYNFVGNNNDPRDDNGHGSHCAGTVAGNGTAGSQTGMAPNAKIMAIKVLNAEGSGSLSRLLSGIQFAVENSADVISMSLGFSGGGDQSGRIQLRNAMNNSLEAGIIAAIAAGNDGHLTNSYPVPNNIGAPGNCPPPWLHPDQTLEGGLSAVVCVGATNQNDQIAYFSSIGPVTWQEIPTFNDYPYQPEMGLIRPDVVAPGVNIKSLRHNSMSGYTTMSGTSMATPCVAGVMALLLSAYPTLTPAEICEILQTTALPLSETKSNIYGAGRVNAFDAITTLNERIRVKIDSIIINDVEGNNNGLLNPGETVNFSFLLKNEKQEQLDNVVVTITTDNEMVVINDDNFVIDSLDELEIIDIQNAFSITLSENAEVRQEIVFTLNITSDDKFCEQKFKIIVYDYNYEIMKIVIPIEEPLTIGDTSDILIYLKNSGNQITSGVTGTIISNSDYLIINQNEQFYGNLYDEQYKYRKYNITISPSTPETITEFDITMIVTDGFGKTVEFIYEIDINEVNTNPDYCAAIENLSVEIIAPLLKLIWEVPEESIVEKYLIYCNNIFITETTSTTYISENVEQGIYNYCIEALYEDGCTSDLYCEEIIMPGVGIDKTKNNTFNLYPNPFKNEIYVSCENNIMNIEILNLAGQKIKNVVLNKNLINTSNLNNGVYFVVIETFSGEKSVYKMVK